MRNCCFVDCSLWVCHRPNSSCPKSLDVVVVVVGGKLAAQVEGYPSKSLEVQYRPQARLVGLQSASAWWQAILCEVWKVHQEPQLPSSRPQHHPCSSSRFVASPLSLCTAVPCSVESPAAPFRSQSWVHSSTGLCKHCGNKSDPVPRARSEGLGLRCSVSQIMSAVDLGYRKARLTHLALEIDRGGASQVTFVVGLLHRRRGRLSQIHVG